MDLLQREQRDFIAACHCTVNTQKENGLACVNRLWSIAWRHCKRNQMRTVLRRMQLYYEPMPVPHFARDDHTVVWLHTFRDGWL